LKHNRLDFSFSHGALPALLVSQELSGQTVLPADSKSLVIDLHIDVCHTFWQGGACELVKLGIWSPNRLSFVAFHSVIDYADPVHEAVCRGE